MHAPNDRRDVEDERDAPVAHDRRAGNVFYATEIRLEALDHNLMLALERIDDERRARTAGFDDHPNSGIFVRGRTLLAIARMGEENAQIDDRQVLVSNANRARAVRRREHHRLRRIGLNGFEDVRDRENEERPVDGSRNSIDDRER